MSVLAKFDYQDRFKHLNWQTAENIKIPEIFFNRYKINHPQIDNLFGGEQGGLMPIVSFTIQGTKGAGKTTFMLQYLSALASQGIRVCYISNEQIIFMLSLMCKRLNITNVPLVNMNDIDLIETELIKRKVQVAILDSFPGLTTSQVERKKSDYILKKVRDLTSDFQLPMAIGIVLHLTKTGVFRGSSDLVYVTDINIELTVIDDKQREIKTTKNRTGETSSIILPMSSNGFTFSSNTPETIVANNEKLETVVEKLTNSLFMFKVDDILNQGNFSLADITNVLTQLVDDDKLEQIVINNVTYWKEK